MAFTYKTTAEEAAVALKQHITGKNVIITGASPKSLGAENVRVLAPYARTIIIASRTKERATEVINEVLKATPSATIKFVTLDLTSEESIRAAAAEVLAMDIPIHVLVNNAAIAHSVTITRTKQGFESNFGANHLGHFLFTALLSPAILRATSPSSTNSPRIINLSSTGAHFAKELRWDDPNFTERPEEYERYVAYALSKYANIAFSKGLAKRLGPKGVLSFSLHPGVILQTPLGASVGVQDLITFDFLNADGSPKTDNFLKSIETGTSTQVIAEFDPALAGQNGSYLDDGAVHNELVPGGALDEVTADKLWELSEKLWGIKF